MNSAVCRPKEGSGETDNVLRYKYIIDAVRLINKNKQQVQNEEALGFLISPAWRVLDNAADHLLKQAHALLRGEEQE
jgi:hypothetical protein